MTTHWEPEPDDDEQASGEKSPDELRPELPAYQIKAHVALEDSDTHSWGIVKDTEGSFAWKPGDGQIVGTWSRSPNDGLIHVFLETAIQGLVDKATLRFAEYAENRRTEVSKPKASRTRTPKEQPSPEPNEELVKIDSLRKLFGK